MSSFKKCKCIHAKQFWIFINKSVAVSRGYLNMHIYCFMSFTCRSGCKSVIISLCILPWILCTFTDGQSQGSNSSSQTLYFSSKFLQYTISIPDESMFVVVTCDTYHRIIVSCISHSQCLILRARLLSLRTLCRLMRVGNWYVCSIIHYSSVFPFKSSLMHKQRSADHDFLISQVSNVVVGVTTGKK